MHEIKSTEDVLQSPESCLAEKLEAYLDSILTKDNTEAQAASIPELGRLLLELYQSGVAPAPLLPPLLQSRPQAIIFRQGGSHEDDPHQ